MQDTDRITEDNITSLGWNKIENSNPEIKSLTYRINPREQFKISYPFELEIIFRPHLDELNQNYGMVCLYMPETEASGIPLDLVKKRGTWTEEDEERAKNHKIQIPEMRQPIAYGVTTIGRLKQICKAVAELDLEVQNIETI